MKVFEIEWSDQNEFPGELGENGFSVDVLVDAYVQGEHTIGWFDWKIHSWTFLSNQSYKRFKWRYFDPEIDNHQEKRSYKQITKDLKNENKKKTG